MEPIDASTTSGYAHCQLELQEANLARIMHSASASISSDINDKTGGSQDESISNGIDTWLHKARTNATNMEDALKNVNEAIIALQVQIDLRLSSLLDDRVCAIRLLQRPAPFLGSRQLKKEVWQRLVDLRPQVLSCEENLLRITVVEQSRKAAEAKHAQLCLQIERASKFIDADIQARDALSVNTSTHGEHKVATSALLDTIYRGCFNEVSSKISRIEQPYHLPASRFPRFSDLPPEIRHIVWRQALPSPRLITPTSRSNRLIPLLHVCQESRYFVQRRYSAVLIDPLAQNGSPIAYVNHEVDTVVRDLVSQDLRPLSLSLLPNTFDFDFRCFRLLYGLFRVKHLALAFDIFSDSADIIYDIVQACCPNLQSLVLFHYWQVPASTGILRFITPDSNLIDWLYACRDRLPHRSLKRRAFKELRPVERMFLLNHLCQTTGVDSEHRDIDLREWKQVDLRVSLMVRWKSKSWSIVPFFTRSYEEKYEGYDGKLHSSFLRSQLICGRSGEMLSRYDGIQRLFKE